MIEGLRRRFQGRRLDAPRSPARFGAHYDPDAFGRFSEGIARFFGTARYLVFQTIMVVSWISIGYFLLGFDHAPVALPAQPRVLDAGRLRRAAHPARAEPPGRARSRCAPRRIASSTSARRPRPSSWRASWPPRASRWARSRRPSPASRNGSSGTRSARPTRRAPRGAAQADQTESAACACSHAASSGVKYETRVFLYSLVEYSTE